MSVSSNLSFAKDAINALSVPSETQRANEWLVTFEKQETAWQVATSLLQEHPHSPFRFFGAKMLYSKLQRQFYQLEDPSALASLTSLLVLTLNKLSEEKPLDMKVCRYLCLSLAVLALQVNNNDSINQILKWMNPSISHSPRIILQLLIILPEECFNYQVDVDRLQRDEFSQQMSRSVPDVISFLDYVWKSSDIDVMLQIIRCLENWVKYIEISSDFLVNQQLFVECLSKLNDTDLYLEASVDLVIAIVQKYQISRLDIVLLILQRVLPLRLKWDTKIRSLSSDLDEDDLQVCQAIARLFAEISEGYIELIISNDPNLYAYQSELIQQLLLCANFSYDLNISRIPLKFFYELSRLVVVGSPDGISEIKIKFQPVFSTLLSICITQMKMPDDCLTGNVKLGDDVNDRRHEWRDTLGDCCDVLGGDTCLEVFFLNLKTEYERIQQSSGSWAVVESNLFCIQSVSKDLIVSNSVHLEHISQFLLAIPPEIVELKITAVTLIGKLAKWVSKYPDKIYAFVHNLITTLYIPKLSVAASRSIVELLIQAQENVSFPSNTFSQLLGDLRSKNLLSLPSELNLIEATCVSISRDPLISKIESFWMLLEPILNSLQAFIDASQRSAVDSSSTKSVLTTHLDKLTIAFRSIAIPGELVLQAFIKAFPIVQLIFVINSSDFICEKYCRFLKHSIRSCGMELTKNIEDITLYVSSKFQQLTASGFIYVASILISDYSRYQNGQYLDVLFKMVWSISKSFFSKFSVQEQLTQNPDVVEEYFFFIVKVLKYCPGPFISSESEAVTILQCGISSLNLSHKEAQKGVLLFFETFIQLKGYFEGDAQQSERCQQMVVGVGALLVSGIFKLLSAEIPAFALDENDGCIVDVLWSLRTLYPIHFKAWICDISQALNFNAQKEIERMGLIDGLLSYRDKRDFSKILDDFEFKCRRRRF